jgi:hypothetical protein
MNFVVGSGTPYLVGAAELYCSSGLIVAGCLTEDITVSIKVPV